VLELDLRQALLVVIPCPHACCIGRHTYPSRTTCRSMFCDVVLGCFLCYVMHCCVGATACIPVAGQPHHSSALLPIRVLCTVACGLCSVPSSVAKTIERYEIELQ
jgi:hypothetical protein